MNFLKRLILMNWYRLLLKRNRARYWIEDYPEEATHKVMEKADNAYWNVFLRIISVLLILSFIPMVQAVPQIVITSPENTTYTNPLIDLNYSTDLTTNWSSYSLNDVANISLLSANESYGTNAAATVMGSMQPTRVGQRRTFTNAVITHLSFLLFRDSATYGNVSIGIFNATTGATMASKVCCNGSEISTDILTGTWKNVTFDTPVSVNGTVYIAVEYNTTPGIYPLDFDSDTLANEDAYHYYSGAWSIRGGETPIDMAYGINYTYENTTIIAAEGSNELILYAENTTGELNSSTIYFIYDSLPPTSSNPTHPASVSEANTFTISIDVTDASSSVDTVTLDIFGSNRTMTPSGSTYSVTVTSPFVSENTVYPLNYYFNDTNGHLSNASYTLTVDDIAGGSPEGGPSPSPVITECTDFHVAYYGRIEIGGTPKITSPPVTVPINNGNTTQNIFVRFDYELQSYCKITKTPDNPVYAFAQTSFTFDCVIPPEQIDANIIIFLSEECQQAVPLSLLPDHTLMSNFGDFFRLFFSGSWESFRVYYHGWPVVILLTLFLALGAIIIWW